MRKILIIIESELLAQLYRTNFMVYLDASVKWVNSFDMYLRELSRGASFDLVVAETFVNSVEVDKELLKLLDEGKINSQVVSLGSTELVNEKITNIRETLNVQQILGVLSKKLGVTAQMMASIQVPEFYPIEIEFIMYLKKAPTHLYIELENDYMLFANKDSSIVDLIKNLRKEGVQRIFVKSVERLDVVGKITEILRAGLIESDALNTSQKAEVVSGGFDFFVENYLSPEAAQEVVFMANTCSRVMADVVEESPDLGTLLNLFQSSKNNYLYIHTMLTSYVATHIVRNVQWGGENQVEKLIFVIFFHDIVMAPIFTKYPQFNNEEAMMSSEDVLRSEKQTILNHARLGAEAISSLKKCPIGADQLIKQHHGMSTGIGFATEYKDDISPMAKVIIIAESFVEEFINYKDLHGQNQIDMVNIIQVLNDKFKKNSYKKIVETLLTLKI